MAAKQCINLAIWVNGGSAVLCGQLGLQLCIGVGNQAVNPCIAAQYVQRFFNRSQQSKVTRSHTGNVCGVLIWSFS